MNSNLKLKIFIVEDEIIVADDIRRILTQNNMKVVGVATKFHHALEEIKEHQPNLILCDINLNGNRTGIQLMKELSLLLDFTIIFISAYSDIETIKEVNELHPFNFITKPFNEQQLLTSIRLVMLELDSKESIPKPSSRELEIIQLVAKGFNNEQIGKQLSISMHTAKTHRRNILKKYCLKNSAELISIANSQKWI